MGLDELWVCDKHTGLIYHYECHAQYVKAQESAIQHLMESTY